MKKNRTYPNKKRSYPTPVQRLDNILVAEVRLALQLGIPEDTIMKNYKITYGQLNYCKKRKVSFQDIYKKEEDE